jgi:hypothetical protein
VGLEQPLELEQRFIVEADIVELLGRQSRRGEAVVNRLLRKSSIVFLTTKSLLFGGSNDLAVDYQRGRGVVIKGRDAEDGGDGAALRLLTTRMQAPPPRDYAACFWHRSRTICATYSRSSLRMPGKSGRLIERSQSGVATGNKSGVQPKRSL